MTILTQDKETLVNYDSVRDIGCSSYFDKYYIHAHYDDESFTELGEYKDEQTAKSVLQRIIDKIGGKHTVCTMPEDTSDK